MRRVANSPNVKKFVEELIHMIESSPNVIYVSDVHERIDGRLAFTIAGKNRRISVIIDDSKDEAIMSPIYYDDEFSVTDEVSAPIDFSDINYSCNSILDVAKEFDFPTSSDLKASKKTAADDIVYDNNMDSLNGIPADYMYFDSDANEEDIYGPVVSIMFDYGKDMYEACYFNNPEKVGLYSGEFDQEPDAVEYFKTRSEAKKWGEDQLRQPMLAFASKKRANSHRLARGFHSRWNESDMYDFVDGVINDINRNTYSDIMAGNLNSYEGADGEVYTFDIMSDYFTLYVEVDGTNVSISCEDDPSLDQAWDFDEDYSSSDLAEDLSGIASDAEEVFIEMSEEEDSEGFDF